MEKLKPCHSIFSVKNPRYPPTARGPHLPPLSSISPSSLATTIDAAGVVAVVILEMEVGPGCACVVVVERLVSKPAGGAALCRRHRRAPRLRAGGSSCTASSSSLSPSSRSRRAGRPGCAVVVVVECLVSEPAGQTAPASLSSSPSSRSRQARLRLQCHRLLPRQGPRPPPLCRLPPSHRRVTVLNPCRRHHRPPSPVPLVPLSFALGSPVARSP